MAQKPTKPLDLGEWLRPREHQLGNGLRIRLLPQRQTPVVAYQTFFRVGSRNERVGRTGIAHLFEHMMFNGATRYGPKEFDRQLEAHGGSSNAYTSYDLTVYHEEIPAEALDLVIDLESDRMAGLRLDDASLQSEREVVKEERRLRVEESVFGRLDEELGALLYQAHPYHWPVIGWMSDLDRISLADCQDFFRRYYAPNNAILCLAGDFDPEQTLQKLESAYGPLPRGPDFEPVPVGEPDQRGERRASLDLGAQTPALTMGYRADAATGPHAAALDLLQALFCFGEGALLVEELVHRRQLCTEISIDYGWRIDPGAIVINAELPPGGNLRKVEEAIQQQLDRWKGELIPPARLRRAQTQLTVQLLRELSSNAGRAHAVGNAEQLLGSVEAALGQVDRIQSVTRAMLREAAEATFSLRRRSLVTTSGSVS